MPTQKEFERGLKEQRHNYPELSQSTWKKFRESCRETLHRHVGARFAVGLGRKKLKNIEKDMQALLEEASTMLGFASMQ